MAEAMTGWSVIHEYTKTVVTLAVALLGLTVTFSKDLLGTQAALDNRGWLFAAWGLLALSILFSIWATAALSNYLRRVSDDTDAIILKANISYFALLGGGVLMGVFVLQAAHSWDGQAQDKREALSVLSSRIDLLRSELRTTGLRGEVELEDTARRLDKELLRLRKADELLDRRLLQIEQHKD